MGRIGEGVRLPNRNPENESVRWVVLPLLTTQTGAEWRTFRYPFLIPQTATFQGNKSLMSAELAHQKADKHLCVALRHKVRIRLHPPMALRAEIFAEYCYTKGKDCSFS